MGNESTEQKNPYQIAMEGDDDDEFDFEIGIEMARKAILWKIGEAKAEECEITSHKGFIPNKINTDELYIKGISDLPQDKPLSIDEAMDLLIKVLKRDLLIQG